MKNACDKFTLSLPNEKPKYLGVFDYCGVDKTGRVVCGIGHLSDNKELIEDDILRWQIPEDWSYEDIVTVPLFYSIAYYILKKHSFNPVVKDSILVHRGGLHVSQAIIRVALSEGYKVFTTYTTVEERNLILKLFPEISNSNIYFCKRNSFEMPLLSKTGGKGVPIIVDTSDDMSTVAASFTCLTRYGFFFLLKSSILQIENSIGMLRFTNEAIMHGVVSDVLLDLHPSIKEVIQKGLEIGIKEGHVKPLHSVSLPQDAINLDAIDLLNTIEGNKHKIVISIDGSSKHENGKNYLFTFTGQKTEIILSDEHSFWLDLLNWMLHRGARNVYMLTELRNLVGSSLQRLLSILNKYPSANVTFFPKKHYKGVKTLLSKVNSQKEISSVFLLGKLLKAQTILPELDRLACKCSDDSVIILCEDVRNENTKYDILATCQSRLPDDMTELLALYKKLLPKACFVETVTKCAPHKYNREVDPIFVIPSLKPNEMNNLTSRLFYSTFEARLPLVVEDIDTIAKDLFEDLKRFNFNVFTIIANDWGSAVAFNLAKYLENDGKLVLLVLLNSSPNSVQNWASAVLQLGDDNLINKYIKLPFKIKQQMSQLSDWNEKVNFAVKSSVQEEPNRKEISNALNNLRKYLSSTFAYTVDDGLFHGKCIVYHTKDSAQDDIITQCCAVSPIINILDSSDHREMLEDPEFANKVNYHIPYDHKTAAREMEIDTLGVSILAVRNSNKLAKCYYDCKHHSRLVQTC
uniref:PKS_ER domain-containing protein n=1 Tax=Rhodnius prolixus TaxID=13249 RepID=T1H910_RHOPR